MKLGSGDVPIDEPIDEPFWCDSYEELGESVLDRLEVLCCRTFEFGILFSEVCREVGVALVAMLRCGK